MALVISEFTRFDKKFFRLFAHQPFWRPRSLYRQLDLRFDNPDQVRSVVRPRIVKGPLKALKATDVARSKDTSKALEAVINT